MDKCAVCHARARQPQSLMCDACRAWSRRLAARYLNETDCILVRGTTGSGWDRVT